MTELLEKLETIGKKIINEVAERPFRRLFVAVLVVWAVKWVKKEILK